MSFQIIEENVHLLGRIICLKMDNILDALALLSNEIKLELPLNNGKNDRPIIYPSKTLSKFIDDFNPLSSTNNLLPTGLFVRIKNKKNF